MKNKINQAAQPGAAIKMKSKYKGSCQVCRKVISVGDDIWYNKVTKKVRHDGCYKKKSVPRDPDKYTQTLMTRPFYGSHRNGRSK